MKTSWYLYADLPAGGLGVAPQGTVPSVLLILLRPGVFEPPDEGRASNVFKAQVSVRQLERTGTPNVGGTRVERDR